MIVRASSLTKTPWKNGGGLTTEIVRVGDDRDKAASGDYDWRASFAEVRASGPFSEFAGYDRALVVWEGEGLRLNDVVLRPLEPFLFHGEDKISAELMEGSVRDFGVIFRRDLYTCRLDIVDGVTEAGTLLFVVQGKFKVCGEMLYAQDSWLGGGAGEGGDIASDDVVIEDVAPGSIAIRATLTRIA
jgi:environmental stress-induced protein Ves